MSEPTTPPSESPAPAPLRDKAPRPPGLFPRHLQTWFVAGIAGLIVLVILLTGQPTPTRSSSTVPKPPATVDANQVRIQEYRDRIEEQVRRLQAEQANLALTKQSFASATDGSRAGPSSAVPAGHDGPSAMAQATLEQDQTQRAYRALYADNLAWSSREQEGRPTAKSEGRDVGRSSDPASPALPGGLSPALTAALTAVLSSSKPQIPGPGVTEAQAPL